MKKEKDRGAYEFVNGKIVRKKDAPTPRTNGQRFFESLLDDEDEGDNVEALENAKTNFDKQKIRDATVRVAIVFAIVAVVLMVFLTFGFKFKNVSVSGISVYPSDKIIEWVNENAPKNVLFASTSEFADRLSAAFPEIRNVVIKKDLPNGFAITAQDDVPSYYLTLDGEYYLLSDELKVMSRTDDIENVSHLLSVEVSDVKKAVMGSEIEFYYDYQFDYIKELLADITAHDVSADVVGVNADNKFDITVNYDDRFMIKIGVGENVKTKLTLAKAYIDSLPEGEKGIIDSSSTEKGSYISLMK